MYDSRAHPFFRAEAHHQFHPNDVIGRYVPPEYTEALKAAQRAAGRLDGHGCIDPPLSLLAYVWPLLCGLPLGLSAAILYGLYADRIGRRKTPHAQPQADEGAQ